VNTAAYECLIYASFKYILTPVSSPANHAFLIDILQVNKHLTSLDTSSNAQITDKGWAEIARGLAVHTSPFDATWVVACVLNTSISHEFAFYLLHDLCNRFEPV